MRKGIMLIVALVLGSPLYAEEMTAPGSTWSSLGVSPIEKGNLVDYFHVDQGVVVDKIKGFDVEPYVAVNVTRDTRKLPWNNKEKMEAGLKLVKSFPSGITDIGIAYALERRDALEKSSAETKSGPIVFTSGWFGYNTSFGERKSDSFFNDTPGSFQWVAGNISPFEKNNVIGQARLEQGITMTKIKQAPVDLFYWGQVGFDTQGMAWNNRIINGIGFKVSVPFTGGIGELVGGYECVNSYHRGISASMPTACGPTIKLDLWAGWRKKIGGM